MKNRTYSELITKSSFEDRLDYLKLRSKVGSDTFGFDRVFNQTFYRSEEWKRIRQFVILRDKGCDLGIYEHEIPDGIPIFIHHMNPITINDLENKTDFLLNPEYLITTTFSTHNIIHYDISKKSDIPEIAIARSMNDTCPWRK